MSGKTVRSALGTAAITFALSLYASLANASVVYQWICDAPDCNGDTTFTSSIEISDSAFAAGSFVGVAGNVLSWNTHQGFGGGYDLTLANIATYLQDDVNLSITLSADRSVISALYDTSSGTNITFADAQVAQHRVDFIEGTMGSGGYKADSIYNPDSLLTRISGHFARIAVPAPSPLGLLGLGLICLYAGRRRNLRLIDRT